MPRAFGTAGHAQSDEPEALRLDFTSAPPGVPEICVARINQHIALIEQRQQRGDLAVDRRVCRHHQHDRARRVQRRNQRSKRIARGE